MSTKQRIKRPVALEDERPGITIDRAYRELTPASFALWLRMMVISQLELNKGRAHLSRLLGESDRTLDRRLRELRTKGYIAIESPTKPGRPSKLRLKRRAVISGADHFIKLSRMVTQRNGYEFPDEDPIVGARADRKSKTPDWLAAIEPRDRPSKTPAWLAAIEPRGESMTDEKKPTISRAANSTPDLARESWEERRARWASKAKQKIPEIQRQLKLPVAKTVSAGTSYLSSEQKDSSSSSDDSKNERAPKRSAEERITRSRQVFTGKTALRIRGELLAPARSKNERSDRRILLAQLGAAFLRVYRARRLEVEPDYQVGVREREYADQAASNLILKQVTPDAAIDYWLERIGDFTSMRFPSIRFLASDANLDEVRVSMLGGGTASTKRKRRTSEVRRIDESHAFADPSRLHPKLRSVLIEAGFDLSEWPDRHLLSVQLNARALAAGKAIFMPGRLRKMAEAVQHLFGG